MMFYEETMSFERFEELVGSVAEELPDELFNKLTGGIIVKPMEKLHEKSLPQKPLYIAGRYVFEPRIGRHIEVYYGSFLRLGFCTDEYRTKEHIRRVLLHELRHHWESLSGERDLEIEDEEGIDRYLEENSYYDMR